KNITSTTVLTLKAFADLCHPVRVAIIGDDILDPNKLVHMYILLTASLGVILIHTLYSHYISSLFIWNGRLPLYISKTIEDLHTSVAKIPFFNKTELKIYESISMKSLCTAKKTVERTFCAGMLTTCILLINLFSGGNITLQEYGFVIRKKKLNFLFKIYRLSKYLESGANHSLGHDKILMNFLQVATY
ncbi:hypothetical protein ACJX0J_032571, partial [Zea mays]